MGDRWSRFVRGCVVAALLCAPGSGVAAQDGDAAEVAPPVAPDAAPFAEHAPGAAAPLDSAFPDTAAPDAAPPDDAPIIVPYGNTKPIFYENRDGSLSGAYAEIIDEVLARIGRVPSYRAMETPRDVVQSMRDGRSDMFPGLDRTNFGPDVVRSDPFANVRVRLYMLAERAAGVDPETVSRLRIGIVPPVAEFAMSEIGRRNTLVEFAHFELALLRLLEERIDGLILSETFAMAVARSLKMDDRIVAVGQPLSASALSLSVNKRHAHLLPAINGALAAMAADGRLDQIKARYMLEGAPPVPDVLTVGVTHFPPFQEIYADGTVGGFAVDVMRNLAARADLRLVFKPIDRDIFAEGPRPGTYDMLAQVGVTEERARIMDFTLPIKTDSWSLFVRPGDSAAVGTVADLEGRAVAIERQSHARALLAHVPDVRIVTSERRGEILDLLLTGQVAAALVPTAPFLKYLAETGKENDVVEIVPPVLSTVRAPALRFGLGAVRERLNGIIPGYLVSAEYQALDQKWFGAPTFWTTSRLRLTAGALAGIVILLLGWTLALFWSRRIERTHLVAAEAANVELDRLNRALARSNHELDEFAFVASHDLRTPLRGIAINAHFLLGGRLAPPMRKRVQRMVDLCVRSDEIITALLDFARLKRAAGPRRSVDTELSVAVLRDLMAETLDEAGAEIIVETPLPRVRMAPERLRTVFQNLVSNAVLYNRSPLRRVRIGFTDAADVGGETYRDAFYVADNGIGIAPAHRDKVFRVFSRVHEDPVFGEGTGMGLAFVKQIVEEEGGRVGLVSEPGSGTVFYFTLPLVRGAGKASAASEGKDRLVA